MNDPMDSVRSPQQQEQPVTPEGGSPDGGPGRVNKWGLITVVVVAVVAVVIALLVWLMAESQPDPLEDVAVPAADIAPTPSPTPTPDTTVEGELSPGDSDEEIESDLDTIELPDLDAELQPIEAGIEDLE